MTISDGPGRVLERLVHDQVMQFAGSPGRTIG
jgi:hypothetical protein